MATLTSTQFKTANQTLLALTITAANAVTKGAELDVSTKESGNVFVRLGRTGTTSMTGAVEFRLESSSAVSANDWQQVFVWQAGNGGTAAVSTAVSITATLGSSTVNVAATTSISNGADLLVYHAATVADSEFIRAQTVTSPNITTLDPLLKTHTLGGAAVVTSQAEQWVIPVDLQGIKRLRIVVDAARNGTLVSTVAKAEIVTTDSVLTV
jgi:hypothetical protein